MMLALHGPEERRQAADPCNQAADGAAAYDLELLFKLSILAAIQPKASRSPTPTAAGSGAAAVNAKTKGAKGAEIATPEALKSRCGKSEGQGQGESEGSTLA